MVAEEKLDCWQSRRCGREPGGANADELGVCVATTESRVDGVNGGHNAGRVCWVVAGTLCGGEVQGSFAAKLANCRLCDFYMLVKQEEADFVFTPPAALRLLEGD